ncbi:tetratricopeptide repeat protein [Streptomyces abyssomicinicus]|uniref:tetratricopeptide repeat protein n=1 Tax=Streptomyces abyssomicinicus TaxID=574929 RepID=UPI00124FF9A2|nr:tetratricopeptide repeat protein [Streptomyces abyssomicinicus]
MSDSERYVSLDAQASGQSRIYQAGRDLYVNEIGNPAVPPTVIPLSQTGRMRGDFVGRDGEIERIFAHLQPQGEGVSVSSVLVLSGLGGIGKTELATRAARLAVDQNRFPGGAVSVDLRGYEALSDLSVYPHQVYSPLLKALGVDAIDPMPENVGPQFHAELEKRAGAKLPVLILLDNARDPEQVLSLIPDSHIHRVIVTSRNAIAPLIPGAINVRLDVLSPEDAVSLIKVKARRELPLASGLSLAKLCGHLPLALSVVGAILASDPELSVAELVGELTQEEQRLEGLEHENVAVRAAFERSYVRLNEFHAAAFRSLALAPGTDISVEVTARLLDNQELKARRALRHLLNCHLVEAGHGPGRWRMHDLVRLYATEQAQRIDSKELRDAAQVRAVSYLSDRAELAAEWTNGHPRNQSPYGFSDRSAAMEWLATEASNLVASAEVAAELEAFDKSADLSASVVPYLINVADFSSSLSVLSIGIEAAKRSEDRSRLAGAYNNLGITYTSMRKHRDAVRWFNKSVATARSLGDRDAEAKALINLSGALRDFVGVEAGMEPLERAMRLGGGRGESEGFGLTNAGIALRESGKFQEAEKVLRQALAIHARKGARKAEASTLAQLGTAIMQRATRELNPALLQEGANYLGAAIAAFRDVRDRQGEAMCFLNLGNAFSLAANLKSALEHYQSALELSREAGDSHGEGMIMAAIGLALVTRGEKERGRSALREAQRLLEPFHEPGRKQLIAKHLQDHDG